MTSTTQSTGKVWFITGATRGLGAEIAKTVLAAGGYVVATGRNKSVVEQAFDSCDLLLPVELDVSREDQCVAAVQAAVEKFGRIDVVVNNAGFGLFGALEEVSDTDFRKQFDTNVFGLLNVTRSVLPVLRKQRKGHIINISSAAGFLGLPFSSAYCASKFAVEGITECLAGEVAHLGINVTVVQPGYFRTDFLTQNSYVFTEKRIDDYNPITTIVQGALEGNNGKQEGDPKKLAAAILTLANAEKPPLRSTAGKDAVDLFEKDLAKGCSEIYAWRELSVSLVFDN